MIVEHQRRMNTASNVWDVNQENIYVQILFPSLARETDFYSKLIAFHSYRVFLQSQDFDTSLQTQVKMEGGWFQSSCAVGPS